MPLSDLANIRRPRRDLLRIGGGLALTAVPWPGLLDRGRHVSASSAPFVSDQRPARSCIFVYLLGGPSHLDSFDLKPGAPAEVRGPFAPIATPVPGVQICEHLPKLANLFGKYALVRSVSHRNSNHTPMIYYTLTGRHTAQPEVDNDVRPPQRSDFPHIGAVLAHLKGSPGGLPGYVAVPEAAVRSSTTGEFKRARTPLRGGGAGFLGVPFDPLTVNGEPGSSDAISAFTPPPGFAERGIESRSALLAALECREPENALAGKYSELRTQALQLTGRSSAARQAFSLDGEPAALQERYGAHRFGKALLLARRLATAGVPMIAVHFNEMTVCDGWDTHSKNFEGLQTELLPMLDQGLSALLSDLDERGQLDETLVVCLGEFGRTPKINANAGRDHWGPCSSALLAGGGIRGGQVLGASDAIAAYPTTELIDPVDLHATMYSRLGVDPRVHIVDPSGRPWEISTGRVLTELL
jgi:hypothetical protein